MLGDTFKVLVLSVLTVVVFHLLLQFAQQRMGRTGGIGFGSATFGRRRARRVVRHQMTPVHESFTSPTTAEDDHSHVAEVTAAPTAPTDLESELKAWMQRESSSWAASNDAPSAAPDDKSTSIDSVFAAQKVQMDDVAPVEVTVSGARTTHDTSTKQADNATYCNPMNTGDWGADGLLAFDTMQDSYATV